MVSLNALDAFLGEVDKGQQRLNKAIESVQFEQQKQFGQQIQMAQLGFKINPDGTISARTPEEDVAGQVQLQRQGQQQQLKAQASEAERAVAQESRFGFLEQLGDTDLTAQIKTLRESGDVLDEESLEGLTTAALKTQQIRRDTKRELESFIQLGGDPDLFDENSSPQIVQLASKTLLKPEDIPKGVPESTTNAFQKGTLSLTDLAGIIDELQIFVDAAEDATLDIDAGGILLTDKRTKGLFAEDTALDSDDPQLKVVKRRLEQLQNEYFTTLQIVDTRSEGIPSFEAIIKQMEADGIIVR